MNDETRAALKASAHKAARLARQRSNELDTPEKLVEEIAKSFLDFHPEQTSEGLGEAMFMMEGLSLFTIVFMQAFLKGQP